MYLEGKSSTAANDWSLLMTPHKSQKLHSKTDASRLFWTRVVSHESQDDGWKVDVALLPVIDIIIISLLFLQNRQQEFLLSNPHSIPLLLFNHSIDFADKFFPYF